MAKDGTNRCGRRVRAGAKLDALTDKIADKRSAKVLEPIASRIIKRNSVRAPGFVVIFDVFDDPIIT